MFLAKKYSNSTTQLVDINAFQQDFRRMVQKKGMMSGTFTQHL